MKKRHSHLIKPFQILLDILIINTIVYLVYDKEYLNVSFLSYITVFWLITSYFFGFYKVFRHTKVLRIFTLLSKQFSIFILGYFAYFGIFREGDVVHNQFLILTSILLSITIVKFFGFLLLKKYRSWGNNYRTTIVLGFDDSSKKVINLFNSKANLGYQFLGFFSEKEYKNSNYLGKLKEVYNFVQENIVDEIYCSLSDLTNNQIKNINKFANEKGITLKLIQIQVSCIVKIKRQNIMMILY